MRTELITALLALMPGLLPAQATNREPAPTVRLNGEVQVRLLAVHAGRSAPADADLNGFQVRRARLVITGALADPRFTWRVRPAYDRATGTLALDDAWLMFKSGSEKIAAGQFKPQFLREEIVSGFMQLGIERSYAADYFTIDYTQGVEAGIERPRWRLAASLHDGSYGANTDFSSDRTGIAANARLELRSGAPFAAFQDFSAWPGAAPGLMLGVALDAERGERAGAMRMPGLVKWTADLSLRRGRLSAFGAYTSQHLSAPDTLGLGALGFGAAGTETFRVALDGATQRSALAQLGYFVRPERVETFLRGEWIDWGGVYYRNAGAAVQAGSAVIAAKDLTLVTGGANWYVRHDAVKLSLDVTYAADPVPVANTGGGVLRADRKGQTVVRSQFQLRF